MKLHDIIDKRPHLSRDRSTPRATSTSAAFVSISTLKPDDSSILQLSIISPRLKSRPKRFRPKNTGAIIDAKTVTSGDFLHVMLPSLGRIHYIRIKVMMA